MTVQPRQTVSHEGRPAVVLTRPEVGATGALLVGIRYTDVPRWEPVAGFPNMQKPASGSCAIVRVEELS